MSDVDLMSKKKLPDIDLMSKPNYWRIAQQFRVPYSYVLSIADKYTLHYRNGYQPTPVLYVDATIWFAVVKEQERREAVRLRIRGASGS